MPAGCGNLQGAFYIFLPHYIPEVGKVQNLRFRLPGGGGVENCFAFQMGDQAFYIRNAIDRQTFGKGGFGSVFCRDKQLADAGGFCGHSHGQDTGDAPQGAGKAQFTDKGGIRREGGQIAVCGENTHKNGEIINCSGFSFSSVS